jgi:DNA polymerase III alpha subunit
MSLYEEQLQRFHTVKSTELNAHVGRTVVMAGMLTTAKPVRTINDEPMEFATFDDGHGLVEAVIFPEVYKARVHVLFDQGPFLLRGKVEEEYGAVTLTVAGIERVDRVGRVGRRSGSMLSPAKWIQGDVTPGRVQRFLGPKDPVVEGTLPDGQRDI